MGADAVEQSMDGRVSGTNTTENPKVGPQRQLSQRVPRICASRSWPLLVLGVPSSVGVPPVTLQCACNSPQKGTGTTSKRDALCCNWSQSAVGVGSLLLPWPECANAMPVCRRVPGAPGSRLVHCSIHSCTTYQNQHKPGVMDSRVDCQVGLQQPVSKALPCPSVSANGACPYDFGKERKKGGCGDFHLSRRRKRRTRVKTKSPRSDEQSTG